MNDLQWRYIEGIRKGHWETRFAEPERFKSENGHCNVTRGTGKLGTWVHNMRYSQKKGELSEEQKKRLDNVGFAWQGKGGMPSNAETMLAELETFKSKHRHCSVPQKSGKLGTWVKNARSRPRN